jgi:L-ascorbate metabolism protein UlaG (beta-lactamase superfamily)
MAEKTAASAVYITWLGQAGFLIEKDGTRIVIDPYLSDSLAEKYKNKMFPHKRMAASPFTPAGLVDIDFVLCTHGHSDHMDPGTLPGLAEANPDCRFICPASEEGKALGRGVPADRIVGINADESFNAGIELTAIASAHEELSVDDAGRNLYLGYVINSGGYRIYHSGDCVPYKGLVEKLKSLGVDVALLPVNGRDEYRKSNGVPGNFTVDEAVKLCVDAGIELLIPHHFGMFDFNTEDPSRIKNVLSASGLNYTIPVIGKIFEYRRNK